MKGWLLALVASAQILAPGALAGLRPACVMGGGSCCVEIEAPESTEAVMSCCSLEVADEPTPDEPQDERRDDCRCLMTCCTMVRAAVVADGDVWDVMEFGVEAEWIARAQTLTPRDVQLSLLRPPRA